MSTRFNNGSHSENHQRATELHEGAEHAHRAAEHLGQQEHELSDCIIAQKASVDARLRVTDAMNATIAARDVLTEYRLFRGC